MTYATQDDMVQRFGETDLILLTNDDASATTIDSDILSQALSTVGRTIDGYLADRFALPLTQVPAQLVDVACDLARYRLSTRNGNVKPTDAIRDNKNDAMQLLRDISQGKLSLGLDSLGAPVPASGITQSVKPERSFTRETMRDYEPMNRHRHRRRF